MNRRFAGKGMNSHNTDSDLVAGNKPADSVADEDETRAIKTSLFDAADLAVSEEDDKGSDPYNSTGQHVIIAPKTD
jgi:hypothetical protein